MTIVAVGDAVNGMVFMDGTTITYEHDDSETIIGSFSYTASDGAGADTTTVEITVTPVDDVPATTEEDDVPAVTEEEATMASATPGAGATEGHTPESVATPSSPQDTTPDGSVPETEDGGMNVGLIVLIIVLAAAIAGIGAVVVVRRRKRT